MGSINAEVTGTGSSTGSDETTPLLSGKNQMQQSTEQKLKDFQLIHVPQRAVSVCVCVCRNALQSAVCSLIVTLFLRVESCIYLKGLLSTCAHCSSNHTIVQQTCMYY